MTRSLTGALLGLALAAAGSASPADPTQITTWSNWPDEPAKRDWVSARFKDLEAANKQCTVKLGFIPKADIYTQAKSAVRTGQAPGIFYMEPDQPEFLAGGFLEPLDGYIDLAGLEDWAKPAWTSKGKIYGLPVEAHTVELYYNKDAVKKVGVDVPASLQLTEASFLGLLLFESLLRKLGRADYGKLLAGELSFLDPRVVSVPTCTTASSGPEAGFVKGRVYSVEPLGAETLVGMELAPGVEGTARLSRGVQARIGERVELFFPPSAAFLFDPASTRAIPIAGANA